MQLHSLFITPVFSIQLKGHEHLIDTIYQLREKDEMG